MNCHVPDCEEETKHVCEDCNRPVCDEHGQLERTIGAWFCNPIDFHKGPPFRFYCDEKEPEEVDPRWDEDEYLDSPQRGQAAGINRDNRGRE